MTTREQDPPTAGALAAQALFEGMFPDGYTPQIDLTLPAEKSPTAAERATWRADAAA
jgi:hypothetical protein